MLHDYQVPFPSGSMKTGYFFMVVGLLLIVIGKDDSMILFNFSLFWVNFCKEKIILRDSSDGFVIAEKDLELRGPGELMGTRQTGAVHFKIADLARDADLLDAVQLAGAQLYTESPHAIQPLCDRWLGTSTDYAEV